MASESEFSATVRDTVLGRDLNRCARCGRYMISGAHLHHRKLRSQLGEATVQNAITLCGICHHWVHANVGAARALGFIVPSWADPEVTPVLTWRGPMLLDVDGGYTVHSIPAARPREW